MKIFFPVTLVTLAASMRGIGAAQTCSNGITGVQGDNAKGVACCPLTCRNKDGDPECGGTLCRKRDGGKDDCCVSNIVQNGDDCSDVGEAPCFIADSSDYCDRFGGVPSGFNRACCPADSCGGVCREGWRKNEVSCQDRPGGQDSCCPHWVDQYEACSPTNPPPCAIKD